MGNYGLPALSIRPQEQPDLLQKYSQLSQLKSMQQRQAMEPGQLELQQQNVAMGRHQLAEMAQQEKDKKIFSQSFLDAKGDMHKAYDLSAQRGASPESLMQVQPLIQKSDESAMKLVQEKGAEALRQADLMQGIHDGIANAPPQEKPIRYQQGVQFLQQSGIDVSKLPPQYPGDEAFKYIGAGVQGHKAQVEDAFKQAEVAKNMAQAQEAQASIPGKVAQGQLAQQVLQGTRGGLTPEQQVTKSQGQQRIGLEAAAHKETMRHNQASEGALTPEALKMASDQFAATGVMPSMGRGAGIRTQIANQAALDHPTVTLASNAAAFKANQDSLRNVTKTLDTLTAFESTGLKNLKQFTDLAEKIPDTGVPWLNTPIRSLDRNTVGSANMAAVEAARNVALREIARVTNDPKLSGALTDSSRQEVANLIPANASFRQIKAVAKVLQNDMANVHSSLDEQKQAIQQRISGANQPPGQQAPAAAPASGGSYWDQFPIHK